MTKEIMQVNEIISDVTFDAFDYLNNQDHVKFKKILKDNELLYDLYCNKLKHLDLQKEKLNQLMGWLGNESREAEEDDLANNSILKKYNQLNHTSSITTSTTALFANKNICHKEKKYDRRPFLTLK